MGGGGLFGGGGGSSGTKTQYTSSPEQRNLYNLITPLVETAIGGNPLYKLPQAVNAPSIPSARGVLSTATPQELYGISTYQTLAPKVSTASLSGYFNPADVAYTAGWQTPTYDLPSSMGLTPTADWWSGLSPDVMAGIRAPWEEAAAMLGEKFGAEGGAGSARGGYSGAYAAGLGELWNEAAKDIGLQAWNLTYPGSALAYQTEAQRAQQRAAWEQEMLGQEFGARRSAAELESQYAQQAAAERFAAQSQADILNAQAQNAANMYYASTENQRRQALAEQQTAREQEWRNLYNQEGMMDYSNYANQLAQDYATRQQYRQEEIQQQLYPYQMLGPLMGGLSPTLPTGVTTQPENFYEKYVGSLFGK